MTLHWAEVDPVWIHWSQGFWLVTRDGMDLIEKAPRVLLRDVRLVIDPLGLEISRETGKRKTHAWAVGHRVLWGSGIDERDPLVWAALEWQPLVYRPRRGDDHFGVLAADELVAISGADYLDADLERDRWSGTARIAGPRFGETDRRRVQQYGGRR